MRFNRLFEFAAGVALAAGSARGLAPHELLILVNKNSAWSEELALQYADARGVPPENIVRLSLPPHALGAEGTITLEEFDRHIWRPAQDAIATRGLGGRIFGWVYSADFPCRVRHQPAVSLHGATFVGGQLPESGVIATGLWASPLFRGPWPPRGVAMPSLTFDAIADAGLGTLLTPAMSLTWSGARGLDRERTLTWLNRASRADTNWLGGTVHLVTGTDVRAVARQWQFDAAADELRTLGVSVAVTSNFPAGARRVAGVMVGLAGPAPSRIAEYEAGAIADHLTSFAAVFHNPQQTKLTEWLKAGAAAAAGTVVEPYSIWMKFPSARLFAHYARGCSVMESFYQSVASPLQLFIVGDPLLAPAARPPAVRIAHTVSGTVHRFRVDATPSANHDIVSFLLDGRLLARQTSPELLVDGATLPDGHHRLRAAVARGDNVRAQGWAELDFETGPAERRLRILDPAPNAECDAWRGFPVRISAASPPTGWAVFVGGVKVAECSGAAATLRVPPRALGIGPVLLQAVAVFADGRLSRSPPVRALGARPNRPPEGRVTAAGSGRWTAEASDPDGDPVDITWWRPVGAGAAWTADGGRVICSGDGSLTLFGTNRHSWAWASGVPTDAWTADWNDPLGSNKGGAGEVTGLAARENAESPLWVFGWAADSSAWILGQISGTNLTVRASRGRPSPGDGPVRLKLRIRGDGVVEGWARGEKQCECPAAGTTTWSQAGVITGVATARFAAASVRLRSPVASDDGRTCTLSPADSFRPAVRLWDGLTDRWLELPR